MDGKKETNGPLYKQSISCCFCFCFVFFWIAAEYRRYCQHCKSCSSLNKKIFKKRTKNTKPYKKNPLHRQQIRPTYKHIQPLACSLCSITSEGFPRASGHGPKRAIPQVVMRGQSSTPAQVRASSRVKWKQLNHQQKEEPQFGIIFFSSPPS